MNAPDRATLHRALGANLASLGLVPILGILGAGGISAHAQSVDSRPRSSAVASDDADSRPKARAESKNDDDKDKREDKASSEKFEDSTKELAERWEARLGSLRDRLVEDMGPAGEEVRKAWDRARSRVTETFQEEELSAKSLSDAFEDIRDELARSFEPGSPVDRSIRRSLDRLGRELSDAGEAARRDLQETAHRLYSPDAEPEHGRPPRDGEKHRGSREEGKGHESKSRGDVDSARREVRELQQRLFSAMRHLHELERDRSRGDRPMRGPGPRRGREEAREHGPQSRPESEAKPSPKPEADDDDKNEGRPSRDGDGPRFRGPRGDRPGPRAPEFRRGPGGRPPFPGAGPGGPRRQEDNRIRGLEEKMDQLLKQLDRLKKDDDGDKSEKKSDAKEPA